MKNYLVSALALLSVSLFTGCSKDDDNVATPEPTVVGKWRSVKFDYYVNNVLEETENVVEDNNSCPDYVEFKSNGAFEVIEKDADCVASNDGTGTYTFSGSTLVVTNPGSGASSLTVTQLTVSDLVYEITETLSNGTVNKTKGYLKKI